MLEAKGLLKILEAYTGWDSFGIKDQKAFVKERFEHLEEHCRFDIEGADEIKEAKYVAQKAIIKCPVNVEILDENGNVIYTLYDKKEEDTSVSAGRFICYYDAVTGEYIKVVYLNNADKYTIRVVGVDAGDVDIQFTKLKDDAYEYYQSNGLPIQNKGIIILNTESVGIAVDEDNDGVVELNKKMAEMDESVNDLTELNLSKEQLGMQTGETVALGVTQIPENILYKSVSWQSSNEEVVTVEKGVVTAIKEGEAEIKVYDTENVEIYDVCRVIVKKTKTIEKETTKGGEDMDISSKSNILSYSSS